MAFGVAPTTVPMPGRVNGNAGAPAPQPVSTPGFLSALPHAGGAPAPQKWSPRQLAFFQAMHDRLHPGGQVHALGLPSSQETSFEQNFNSTNQGADQNLATNAYQAQLAAQAYGPQFGNEQRVYEQGRAAEPGQFVGRGILGSGIDHEALQNLDFGHLQNVQQLTNSRQQSAGGFQLAAQQIENQRQSALAALRLQHQQALAQYAGSSIPKVK